MFFILKSAYHRSTGYFIGSVTYSSLTYNFQTLFHIKLTLSLMYSCSMHVPLLLLEDNEIISVHFDKLYTLPTMCRFPGKLFFYTKCKNLVKEGQISSGGECVLLDAAASF